MTALYDATCAKESLDRAVRYCLSLLEGHPDMTLTHAQSNAVKAVITAQRQFGDAFRTVS